MMTRRDAVGSLAFFAELLASAGRAEADVQTPPAAQAPRPPVFKHDLPNLTMDGWEVTVSHVDYAPGRDGAPHRHPGFVLAYVLEGAVIAKIWIKASRKPTPLVRCSMSSPAPLMKCRETPVIQNPRACSR